MTHTSTVSPQGQTTIPAPIRKHLDLKSGQVLKWNIDKNELGVEEIKIATFSKSYIKSLRGIAKGIYGKTKKQIDDYIESERNSWDYYPNYPKHNLFT